MFVYLYFGCWAALIGGIVAFAIYDVFLNPNAELLSLSDALHDLVVMGRLPKDDADRYWQHALECSRSGVERPTWDEFFRQHAPDSA